VRWQKQTSLDTHTAVARLPGVSYRLSCHCICFIVFVSVCLSVCLFVCL